MLTWTGDRGEPDTSEPLRRKSSRAAVFFLPLGVALVFFLTVLTLLFRSDSGRFTALPALAACGVIFCTTTFVVLTYRMQQELHASRAEIIRLQRTLMPRAEHLATMAEIATGLAHEIRNPLAGIAGVIEIIARDLTLDSPARSVVKEARQQIARINHITSDLVHMVRPHPPKVLKSDLNTTVEHAVMLGRQQALGKPVEIALHKDPDLPEVAHDSAQIHQVMFNLLLHALQAMESNGKITVTLRAQGATAVVEVSHNGCGIPSENLPHIFRPFYAAEGENALGLSMARRIVEEHHGRIDVVSQRGAGATFSVVLPFSCSNNSHAA